MGLDEVGGSLHPVGAPNAPVAPRTREDLVYHRGVGDVVSPRLLAHGDDPVVVQVENGQVEDQVFRGEAEDEVVHHALGRHEVGHDVPGHDGGSLGGDPQGSLLEVFREVAHGGDDEGVGDIGRLVEGDV
jgi:hypothetical protein